LKKTLQLSETVTWNYGDDDDDEREIEQKRRTRREMIRQHNQRVIKRPNNFCYHCNETFNTKEDLKYHVENIVKKQLNPTAYSPETDYTISQQNAAGHTLRSDFFQLDAREAEEIQSHLASDVYANFTLDGKECYHCGQEFQSTDEMKNHPARCDRMKNARNIGQVSLNDFHGEVHIAQKEVGFKRQKRKKNHAPKTARPKKTKVDKRRQEAQKVHQRSVVDEEAEASGVVEDGVEQQAVEYQHYDEYEQQQHYDEQGHHYEPDPNYEHHQGYEQHDENHDYQEVQPAKPDQHHQQQEADDVHHVEGEVDEHNEQEQQQHEQQEEEHIQLQPVNYKQRRSEKHATRPSGSNSSQQNNSNSGFHCFHCDHIFNSRQELQQHVNEIAKKNHKEKTQADDYRANHVYN